MMTRDLDDNVEIGCNQLFNRGDLANARKIERISGTTKDDELRVVMPCGQTLDNVAADRANPEKTYTPTPHARPIAFCCPASYRFQARSKAFLMQTRMNLSPPDLARACALTMMDA